MRLGRVLPSYWATRTRNLAVERFEWLGNQTPAT
jgi:hypothetical protein